MGSGGDRDARNFIKIVLAEYEAQVKSGRESRGVSV